MVERRLLTLGKTCLSVNKTLSHRIYSLRFLLITKQQHNNNLGAKTN